MTTVHDIPLMILSLFQSFDSREEVLDATPLTLPLSLHTEDGERLHGFLLTRNTDIEHPVELQFGDEVEYVPLVSEVNLDHLL